MGIFRKYWAWFVLGLIVISAFLVRVIGISSIPIGFNADEASFGYDAYSISLTGKDQWGSFLPLVLKSFGDYKSPLYSYLDVPFIKFLGLTKTATRLPNAFIGTFAVLMVYLLLRKILSSYTDLSRNTAEIVSLAAAFILAFNPWSVMMSRGAFEANLITFFLPAGIYFFLKGIENYKFFAISALFFGLDLFTYHSAKVITPLVVFGLVAIFWRKLIKIKLNKLILPVLIFLIFLSGLAYTFILGGGRRVAERSITQGAVEQGSDQKYAYIAKGGNPTVAKLLNNKYTVMVTRFTNNYVQYFSGKYLFVNGAGDTSYGMVPGIAVLYIFEGILLVGLLPLLIKKKYWQVIVLLVLWLLIAPVPAALATGVGYAGNRSEGMLPAIQILEGFGLVGWIQLFKKINRRAAFLIVLMFCGIATSEILVFAQNYFAKTDINFAKGMLYGDLETATWLTSNSDGERIIISRALSEPQIFIAFADKWDPTDYQKATKTWGFDKSGQEWVDQLPEYSLGNYTFKSIDWKKDVVKNTILVDKSEGFPKNEIPAKIFYYPDGSPDISILK